MYLPKKERVAIYVVSHKPFTIPTDDGLYIPLMVGNKQDEIYSELLCDQYGDSIAEKNLRYNELTGLYWIWKNSNAEIVGICHYRRYFVTPVGKMLNLLLSKLIGVNKKWLINSDYILKACKKNDIILHNKTVFISGNKNSLMKMIDYKVIELAEVVMREMYPEYLSVYFKIINGKKAHLLNIMICKKKWLDKYCEWIFPLLFEIEKRLDINYPNELFSRSMGALAERFLDIWVMKNHLSVKECFTINTEKIDWKIW